MMSMMNDDNGVDLKMMRTKLTMTTTANAAMMTMITKTMIMMTIATMMMTM